MPSGPKPKMVYSIRKTKDKDGKDIVKVFNYFVRDGLTAFPEKEARYDFFVNLKVMSRGYPFYSIENENRVIGFGLLSPYHLTETFKQTAIITYFILPEHTRKGLGGRLMEIMINDAKKIGVGNIIAKISSANESSLAFHQGQGFKECGKLKNVGKKFGQDFDVIYMQKII